MEETLDKIIILVLSVDEVDKMGLVTWGWGSCDGIITIFGWDSYSCSNVPTLISKFLQDKAYEWVAGTNYIEVTIRSSGTTIMRLKPTDIPERFKSEVALRLKGKAKLRSPGWPFELVEYENS